MSKIEWTGKTWNPVTGCTRVSAGCDHCYAYTLTKRLAGMGQEKYKGLCGKGHFNGVIKTHDDALTIPLKRKKPTMYFVNSMSDLFHDGVPFEFIDKVFAVMALCPQHTFQILTKRPERMAEYLNSDDRGAHVREAMEGFMSLEEAVKRLGNDANHVFDMDEPVTDSSFCIARVPSYNVWLGTSAEDQETLDKRVPELLRCPAAVRFLSLEPLLGKITLDKGPGEFLRCNRCGYTPRDVSEQMDHRICKGAGPGIHWVITGGESGPGARNCNVDWIRSIVRQCKDAGVPCFVKQLGKVPISTFDEWNDGVRTNGLDIGDGLMRWQLEDSKGGDPDEWPEDLRVREMPEQTKEVKRC